MSSRLFQKLREDMGVGYYVRSYNDAYTDHGFFQISAGVDNKRIHEVVEAVLEECNRLKNFEVPKEELEKTKEGNMLVPFSAVIATGDFVVVAEEDIV